MALFVSAWGHYIAKVRVQFCSSAILDRHATPWTHFLHLSLSSVVLTDSSSGSPFHVLVLSTQAVRGLPRLRAPGIVPCAISTATVLDLVRGHRRRRELPVGAAHVEVGGGHVGGGRRRSGRLRGRSVGSLESQEVGAERPRAEAQLAVDVVARRPRDTGERPRG